MTVIDHDARIDRDAPPDAALGLEAISRPRLRDDVPIMWRSQTSIQIGEDVVVDRVTRSHVAWITSLDGMQPADDIVLTIPEPDARRLVRALLAAGALEDAARIPEPLRWMPQPQRDRVSAEFGATLTGYHDLDTAYEAMVRRDACRARVIGSGPLADEIIAMLESARLRLLDADSAPDLEHDITILTQAPHPHVPAAFDDEWLDGPHLHVATFADVAVVGPLVVPGVTSCLRCAHLHRRDADPAWPLIAVQWSHAISSMPLVPRDPALTRLASAQAVMLARAWADRPHAVEAWANVALETRLPLGITVRIPRPPHPLCGCRWAG